MRAISEPIRVVLVGASMALYLLGVYFVLPHPSAASEVTRPTTAVSPAPLTSATLAPIPALGRDVFEDGLDMKAEVSESGSGVNVPPPASVGTAVVPGLQVVNPYATSASGGASSAGCRIAVKGTLESENLVSGKEQILARISVNGGSAQRYTIHESVCGQILKEIDFDGVVIGGVKYHVDPSSSATVSTPANSTTLPTMNGVLRSGNIATPVPPQTPNPNPTDCRCK